MFKKYKNIAPTKVIHTEYGDVTYTIMEGTPLENTKYGQFVCSKNNLYPNFYSRKEYYDRVITKQSEEYLNKYAEYAAKSMKKVRPYIRISLISSIIMLATVALLIIATFFSDSSKLYYASFILFGFAMFSLVMLSTLVRNITAKDMEEFRSQFTAEEMELQIENIGVQIELIENASYKIFKKETQITSLKMEQERLRQYIANKKTSSN